MYCCGDDQWRGRSGRHNLRVCFLLSAPDGLAGTSGIGGGTEADVTVPDLGVIIRFFGSLNAPMLVLILPPLIATRCLKPSNKTGRYTIAFAGLVMSALGVTGAVSDIVSGNASGGERR